MPELTRPIHGTALRLIDPIYFVALDDLGKPVLVIKPPEVGMLPVYPVDIEMIEPLRHESFDSPGRASDGKLFRSGDWGKTAESDIVELVIRLKVPRSNLVAFLQ